jgi:uncharacterized protein YaiI (UPF0178 family)
MRIWVDADACPRVIKDILFRAAERAQVSLTLVANQPLRVIASPWIRTIQVERGFDVADARIAELAEPGDLVITADIPLAAKIVAKGAQALDPRGELYTTQNIGERLAMRDFMDGLRGAGVETGGPPALGAGERAAFANQLDRLLAARGKR